MTNRIAALVGACGTQAGQESSFIDELASVVSRGLNFEPLSTSRHIVKTSAQEETR